MRNNEQLNSTVERSVWQDFLLFLKDPHAAGATIYRWGTLGLFAVPLLLNILCVLLKGWITQEPMIDDASDLVALTPEKLLLFILLYPLIEELGFRGFLLFHKKKYVVIAALPILALLSLGESWYGELPWLRYPLMLLVALWLGSMLVNRKARDWTLGLIGRHKRVLIYASSIAFGCVHLMNDDHFAVINLLPIVPKVVSGLFGAYVTVRSNSIVPSWLFHAANNSVASLISTCVASACETRSYGLSPLPRAATAIRGAAVRCAACGGQDAVCGHCRSRRLRIASVGAAS